MQISSDDNVAVVFPITHVGGLLWTFNMMENAARLLLVEIYAPVTTIPFLAAHDVTCAGAGTVFHLAYLEAQRTPARRAAVPEGPDLQRRRRAQAADAPLRADGGDGRARDLGAGASPSCSNITMVPLDAPDDKKATTEGRPGPGVRAARRRTRRGARARPRGEEGELRVKGPQCCLGYLDSSLDADAFDDRAAGSAPATSA